LPEHCGLGQAVVCAFCLGTKASVSREHNIFKTGITRKGVVVWCALLLFVMTWMFVLGILVGRGTAPLPAPKKALENELDEIRAAMLDKAGRQAEAQGNPNEPELGFYEALKKAPAKTDTRIPPPPAPKKKTEPAPAAPVKAAAPAPAAVRTPAESPSQPVVKEAAAQPKPPVQTEARSAPPSPSPVQDGRYTIQIAAYRDARSAEKMVEELRAKGYPGYFLHTEIKDKGFWFRVRVGAFNERTAAEGMLKRLNGDRYQGMVVGTP
jgi:DedD protein